MRDFLLKLLILVLFVTPLTLLTIVEKKASSGKNTQGTSKDLWEISGATERAFLLVASVFSQKNERECNC